MAKIKVVVVDDHEVVREGVKSLLAGSSIDVVGEADEGEKAVKVVKRLRPDVVLMDIRMPGSDGLHALDVIRKSFPDVKVVMLSTYDNPTYIARSAALGASDYVLKGSSRKELIAAIEAAASSSEGKATEMMKKVSVKLNSRRQPDENEASLTNRESQVLRHVALGLSNKEIGRSLGISVETVKEHVQNILRKVGVTDRTQAAVWAVRKEYV